MPLKFAANISMLFSDIPVLANRFKAAKDAGFKFVECAFPYSEDKEVLGAAKKASDLEHVLMNGWPGLIEKGELGLAALPDRVAEFRDKLEESIQYANKLDCKRMHIMAGRTTGYDITEMEKMYLDNLRYTADRLQKDGILCLIEPLNTRITAPNYFLNSLHKGVEYVRQINHPNLKLQFDIYHAQMIAGDVTFNLKQYQPYIGHIQIAQAPDRGEPDLTGEINYHHILKVLEDMEYDGYIGLEYKPKGDTVAGLKWMQELGYSL